jgi:hypothetical protein
MKLKIKINKIKNKNKINKIKNKNEIIINYSVVIF